MAYATAYRYDASGRMDRITYPSGRTVNYSFDSLGRISAITTTPSGGSAQSIVSSLTYHPFGGVKGFTFGNAQTYARSYDQDGRVSTYTLAGAGYTLTYDLAGRISFLTDAASPPNISMYDYDALDRLTDATVPSGGYEYTYDAVGNRLTKLVGSNTHTYAYGTTSNRIASITPTSGPVRSFTLDANGSSTADGSNTYSYDTRGRMIQAVSSLGTTTYHVNALGQRVRKTNSLGDRVFNYDASGHLIAETTAAGVTLREYVWLGDMPVAVVEGTTRSYVHVDHLNTPRLVANQSGQTVWRWDQQEPFGDNVPNENPSGLGTFEFALRFPGQYADKETNLHYNYFRDYDPSLGRYAESDPIGLRGGLNTYAYVGGKPLGFADPLGLYPGQYPPPPPGYDPSSWTSGQHSGKGGKPGKWWVKDPEGGQWTAHPEDDGHWRHWDHQPPGDGKQQPWPPNKNKPWPNQIKPPYDGQSAVDPSGDAPEWQPPSEAPSGASSRAACGPNCQQTWKAVFSAILGTIVLILVCQ